MPDLPSISVIIPTRNRPAFLAKAVGSVLTQTLLPQQLIIVDDGDYEAGTSSSTCSQVSQDRADEKIEIAVIPGPGRGPGAARNAGLAVASGELIAFLDDDDLWFPDKLELQARCFAGYPALGLLGTGHVTGRESRAESRASRQVRAYGHAPLHSRISMVSPAALTRANRLIASSVMARRDCIAQCGGFDESLSLAQDWDLWLRAVVTWQVALLPMPLVYYRRHSDQRSADLMQMRYWEGEVLRRALARGLPGTLLKGVARRRLAWSHIRLGRLFARRGDADRAREEFRKAMGPLWYNPAAWMVMVRYAQTSVGATFLSRLGLPRAKS